MTSILYKISLQKKFLLIALGYISFVTLVIGFFVAQQSKSFQSANIEKQARVLARTIGSLMVNELIYEELGLVEEGGFLDNYVRELYDRQELDFLYIAVLNRQLRVISHNDFSEYGQKYNNEFLRRTLDLDHEPSIRKYSEPGGSEILECATPLAVGSKKWGVFLFGISLDRLEMENRRIMVMVVFGAVFAFASLALLVFILNRRFIRPIITLSTAMQAFDPDDVTPRELQVRGVDELAQLGTSYNEMANRIKNAHVETKIIHEKLLQSEKLATLGVLSSSIAHRINNPLGGLFNCVKMLRRKGDDREFREDYLNLVEEGLESISRTVSQLLYSAGHREYEKNRADLAETLQNIRAYLDYRMRNQGISFRQQIDGKAGMAVAQHDLEEILLNIMLNSIQAMPDGGELTVNAKQVGEVTTIVIEDTGSGIAEKDLPNVFDLFFSTKTDGEGTGLGMWMTYELIKKYAGKIEVESSKGRGVKVIIELPGV